MARTAKTKKVAKKTRVTKKTSRPETVPVEMDMMETKTDTSMMDSSPRRSFRFGYLAAIVVILIGLVLMTNKGLLLAAVVNGKPVYRWNLTKVLTDRFGSQTLDNMITEQLIAETAAKNNVTVSQKEIDAKEQDIVKSFGGKVTIDELLKFQGMTKPDFDDQVKMQLVVSKILGKDIKIEDKDIADFIEKNKDTLTATEEGALKEEAKQAIFNQKVSEKIQPWFTDLRSKAKIVKFL